MANNASEATESDNEVDFGAVGGPVGPKAPEDYQEPDEEDDEDGLTPAILEARSENQITVDMWCKCGYCKTERLSNALEFRCCNEVKAAKAAIAKLTFEGIKGNCILQHTDFDALTNASVLEQVCPLMKDRKGRSYKFPSRGTRSAKNESCRATAYRFLVRWIFGPLGWNNSRPLPACVYHKIRQKFPTASTRGYSSADQRQDDAR
ncbi:uncharacterized protein LOC122959384 [Acropora millepora]|uniref:uncharacterized protein LOC122959384 n=1 Tax=Acropora millepora TaxID=45264 RepID=UPI001CF44C3B|nr:uncharacterized protein LOC122959384 [Acropora millepora]